MDNKLVEIHLESSTLCNARCRYCVHDDVKRKGMMELSLFTKIVDEAVEIGCQYFTPWLVNEPLIFPDLWVWLEYFRKKGVKAIIFTNAGRLDTDIAKKLIEYSDVIHIVVISFHGGSKEVYEYNMGLDFDITYQNIISFMGMNHTIPCEIFCMMDSVTKDTCSDFMGLWDNLGFKDVGIRARHGWAGYKPDDLSHISNMKKLDNPKRTKCTRIFEQLDVFYDGNVPLCCFDGLGKIVFGNLKYNSIKDIMENPLRRFYQEQQESGNFDILPLCRNCDLTYG